MDSLANVDNAIGLLLDTLMNEGDLGCVNVMVVSTGGVADKNCDRVYYLLDVSMVWLHKNELKVLQKKKKKRDLTGLS